MKHDTKISTGKMDITIPTLHILNEISQNTGISKNILFEISIENLQRYVLFNPKVTKRKNFLISHEGWLKLEALRERLKISRTKLIEIAIHILITQKTKKEIEIMGLQYKKNRYKNTKEIEERIKVVIEQINQINKQ